MFSVVASFGTVSDGGARSLLSRPVLGVKRWLQRGFLT
jgi:hypothetical protein